MDYMTIQLHDLIKAGRCSNHYDGILDALICADDIVKSIPIIDYKAVKNEHTLKMINALFRGEKNEFKKYTSFHEMIKLFLAKYLFIYDLAISNEIIEQFKNDFIGGVK